MMVEEFNHHESIWRSLNIPEIFSCEIAHLKNKKGDTLYLKKARFSKNPKKTIYFLHDILDHHDRYFKTFVSFFNSQNFQDEIIFFDYPGHGLSSGTRGHFGSMDDLLEDFIQVLSLSRDTESFYIWGHGLGALLSLYFCLNDNKLIYKKLLDDFKGLIVANFYFELFSRINPMVKLLEVVERSKTLDVDHIKLNRLIFGKDQSFQKNIQEHYEADPLVTHRMSYQAYRALEGFAAKISKKSYFVDFPVLFLVGKNDPLTNVEKTALLAKSIEKKYYTLIELPDSKHDLYNDTDSTFVLKEILNWVKK